MKVGATAETCFAVAVGAVDVEVAAGPIFERCRFVVGFGDGDVYRRMATNGGGRMPLFGTSTVDKEGAALIAKWIKSLKK